ncbi:MAG: recombinase family protein [candidate division Zixibacteria bacterium]|nr:recombinase family protein [candidate division Zixibacteria bacterium]
MFEVDPQQSELVREIIQLYNDELSIRDITYHLNDKGHPPPHNARQVIARKSLSDDSCIMSRKWAPSHN